VPSNKSSEDFATNYPSAPPNVENRPIDNEVHSAIGRLIRGIADFEECVDCFIFNLLGIREDRAAILLGKTTLSKKIEICGNLADTRDDAASEVCKQVFTKGIKFAIKARNVLAHGSFMAGPKMVT